MKVLHVLNYGWPYLDGYTARSIGLTGAQRHHLDGVEVVVATSPFPPLAQSVDEEFGTADWAAEQQIRATRWRGGEPLGVRAWERPAIGLSPSTSAAFERELESVARRVRADLLHVHHPHYVAEVALRVAGRLGLPAVYELRCFNGYYDLGTRSPYRTLRGRWQNELEFALARDASATVTIGDALAATLRDNGVDDGRLFVVRNSVDTERFTPGAAREGWASRLAAHRPPGDGRIVGTAPLTLHVGYATTFERMENLDAAVEAACLVHGSLRERGIELTLTLAGNGRDWSRIAALVDAREAGGFVKLPGHLSYGRMPDFYRGLDLFLVPRGSHVVAMDTTPLKPLEALACGLPLLVTDLPAMRELLRSREDVRFTAPDAASMASGLLDFATAPWRGGGPIDDRAWPIEVQRYAAVYAAAVRHGPPRPSGRRRAMATLRSRQKALGERLGGLARRGLATVRPGGAGTASSGEHLIVCGFPRTGSTLLQLMVECCVPGVRTFEGEVEALDVAQAHAPQGRLLSKCPDDVFAVRRIASRHAAAGRRQVHFLLTVRDPRDIMSSRHAAYAADRGYYVTPERFVAVWRAVREAREREESTVLRYEDLVADPTGVQALFAERFGWSADLPFARFHERASERERDSMTDGALGGLRPLDAGGVARWRNPAHRARLRELARAMPELVEACIDLGYERDAAWTRALHDDVDADEDSAQTAGAGRAEAGPAGEKPAGASPAEAGLVGAGHD